MLAQTAYAKIEDFYVDVFEMLRSVAVSGKTCDDMRETADIAYLTKKAAEYTKQLTTQLNKISEVAQKRTCIMAIEDDHETEIRGKYVVASPDMKMMAPIPKRKKEPERFEELMNALEIPNALWQGTTEEAVRPHWPGIIELTNKNIQEGKKLPDGLDENSMYPIYKLRMRKSKKSLRDA